MKTNSSHGILPEPASPLAGIRYRCLARSRSPRDRDRFNKRLSALGACLETIAENWRAFARTANGNDRALAEELGKHPEGDSTLVLDALMDRVVAAIQIHLRSKEAHERLRATETLRLELLTVSVRHQQLKVNFASSLQSHHYGDIVDYIARESQDLAMEFTLVWEPESVSYHLELGGNHPMLVRDS